MCFGKFLFLYLLGRNVEYFVYKQVLDATLESDSAPRTRFTQQMSKSDVQDTGSEELSSLPRYMANAPPSKQQQQQRQQHHGYEADHEE